MLKNILKFLSLGSKSNDKTESNIVEILNSDFSKKRNRAKLENWACNEYLNISDGINEKKYKIILLSFIFNLKNIYLESMPKLEEQIKETSNFLLKKHYYLSELPNLFCEKPTEIISHSDLQYYEDEKINFYAKSFRLFSIISQQDSNLDICKKLYQDFEYLGLLGHLLINNAVGQEFLLSVQDNKLSEKDIEIFRNTVTYLNDKISSQEELEPSVMNFDVYNRIILNENNPENLKLLVEYCNSNEILGKMSNSPQYKTYNCSVFKNMCNTKIEYIEMKSEMDETPFSKASNNKKPKI